jgi:drug/metabolite transporter (DMT)-like permease
LFVVTKPGMDGTTKAKLMLMGSAFCWGLSWPMQKIALEEFTPWSVRIIGFSIGAACLFAIIILQGRPFTAPRARAWGHVFISGLLNVAAFGLFSTFAQLDATTSRVIIINYSMPVWASLMAWLILRERISMNAAIGLALCVLGLTILVYPVASVKTPIGLWLALGCSLSWAAGTIYLKWARIEGDLLSMTVWQILAGLVVLSIGSLIVQGPPTFHSAKLETWLALGFAGFFGNGIGYFLWFHIIGKLPTTTASLGALANPVIGVLGSMALVGETLTLSDAIGFALIGTAALCVLLQRRTPPAVSASPKT